MKAAARRVLVAAAGIALSSVFLLWALQDVRWPELLDALRGANYLFCAGVALTYYLVFWCKALRLSYLLAPVRLLPPRALLPAIFAGHLGGLLLPAYLGEAARVLLAARQFGLSAFSVFSATVVERLLDFLTLLAFIGIVLFLLGEADTGLARVARVLGLLALLATAAVVIFLLAADRLRQWLLARRASIGHSVAERIVDVLDKSHAGLKSLHDPRLVVRVVAASVAHWAVMGACIYVALAALHIDVPFHAAFVTMTLVSAAMTLPSAPGWIGAVQIGFTLGLAPFGVEKDTALAASIVFHATIYVTALVCGLISLHSVGWTWSELRQRPASSER